MSEPICTVDFEFEGSCSACDGSWVRGKMITGEDKVRINGKPVCVTGSIGRGNCGHTCEAVGQSQVLMINGKKVARVGDPVRGTINGKIITGENNAKAD